MTILRFALAAAIGSVALAAAPVQAAGLQCPRIADLGTPPLAAEIDARLPKGLSLERPAPLDSAIALLREHGLSSDDTTNHLIAFYCPAVAAEAGLEEAEKTARVTRFAQRVTRLVHLANSVEDIVYRVLLRPGVAEAAGELAARTGIPVETWIARLVETAVSQAAEPALAHSGKPGR